MSSATPGTFWYDVIMSELASQLTSVSIVCSTIHSAADQRKHQSSVSLAFVQGIHRWPVNSPHKRPVTRKMFPFDDVIMWSETCCVSYGHKRYTQLLLISFEMSKKNNFTNLAIHLLHTPQCTIQTELCTFLFWIMHRGMWDRWTQLSIPKG